MADNVQMAKDGYEAFGRGDAAAAMENMADDIEWIVPGNSAVSGTYRGKQQLGEHWGKLAEKNPRIEIQHWFSDGDMVVALTHVSMDGGEYDSADVLSYRDGKLVKFQSAGGESLAEEVFGSK